MLTKARSYDLGKVFSVTFRWDFTRLECEWFPRMLTGKLGRKLHPKYQDARNRFRLELTPAVGKIMVIE